MKISVTTYDINNGVWADCTACPVALALKRQLQGKLTVCSVGATTVVMRSRAKDDKPARWIAIARRHGHPSMAEFDVCLSDAPDVENYNRIFSFIDKFDARAPVEPFSFEIPDEVLA